MVTISLNGRELQFEEGKTVLEAARSEGIDIPTLCYHESLGPYGVCRLCLVEAEGPGFGRALLSSCNLKVSEGMIVETDTSLLHTTRKTIMELLLATTPHTAPLLNLAKRLGVDRTRFKTFAVDKCVLCGLCVRVCRMKIGASALDFATGGGEMKVAEYVRMTPEKCIGCGSCANICPIDVIQVKDMGDDREILLYGECVNRLKLVRCESCGKPYATDKFLDFVLSRLDQKVTSKIKLRICPDCSREYYTVALTGRFPVFEEFPPAL